MNEFGLDGIPTQKNAQRQIPFAPFGTPVTTEEVGKRLSNNLYKQLSDGDEDFVESAIARAQVYIGTILSWLKVQFDLDNGTVREIVLMQTVYELHMALGHEEAGREYRTQMKNTVIAAYGSFPDSESNETTKNTAASVITPPPSPRNHRLHQARRFTL